MSNPEERFGMLITNKHGSCPICKSNISTGDNVAFDNWSKSKRPICVDCAEKEIKAGSGNWQQKKTIEGKNKVDIVSEKAKDRFEKLTAEFVANECQGCDSGLVQGDEVAFDRWLTKKDSPWCIGCAQEQIDQGCGTWIEKKPAPASGEFVTREKFREFGLSVNAMGEVFNERFEKLERRLNKALDELDDLREYKKKVDGLIYLQTGEYPSQNIVPIKPPIVPPKKP